MNVTVVMAQMIVSDPGAAAEFYTHLFRRGPDTTPMDKLSEWHFPPGGAVQVYEDPERAGASGVTLHVDDLDAEVEALDAIGIPHQPIVEATFVRVVQLYDPDGNLVVLTGDKGTRGPAEVASMAATESASVDEDLEPTG
jgi:predicted enzyme related to lactoylglutathione lyase